MWTQDTGKPQRVARGMRHPYLPPGEWGGMKRSGNGRALGGVGLDEYREIKHIWHNTDPRPQRWFRG